MFILRFLLSLLVKMAVGVELVYDFLRVTYMFSHTERYRDQRPGDALMTMILTIILVVVGLPIFTAVWYFEPISISTFWFVIILVTIFFSPPVITTAMCEYAVFRSRRHPPPQSS